MYSRGCFVAVIHLYISHGRAPSAGAERFLTQVMPTSCLGTDPSPPLPATSASAGPRALRRMSGLRWMWSSAVSGRRRERRQVGREPLKSLSGRDRGHA
jgi:hypothetical protein